ncbi:hypothetical protein GCM10018791_30160 [Streptomyces zaomyceticus]|nr:hypothetical protein GCM10018791_30160 [Streptomyces zaomyceticus]
MDAPTAAGAAITAAATTPAAASTYFFIRCSWDLDITGCHRVSVDPGASQWVWRVWQVSVDRGHERPRPSSPFNSARPRAG